MAVTVADVRGRWEEEFGAKKEERDHGEVMPATGDAISVASDGVSVASDGVAVAPDAVAVARGGRHGGAAARTGWDAIADAPECDGEVMGRDERLPASSLLHRGDGL